MSSSSGGGYHPNGAQFDNDFRLSSAGSGQKLRVGEHSTINLSASGSSGRGYGGVDALDWQKRASSALQGGAVLGQAQVQLQEQRKLSQEELVLQQ